MLQVAGFAYRSFSVGRLQALPTKACAFTSAVADREGAFQLADGGFLFLDEIGELPLQLQAKLLRVIQSKEFRKVGGNHSKHADVRIICATNRDLPAMVARNKFREDLFYRLEVMPITLPPLRDRLEDIPLLVTHFIETFNRQNKRQIRGVTSRAMSALLAYHWPGNVRQLENSLQRAAVMSEKNVLDFEDLRGLLPFSPAPTGSPRAEHPASSQSLKEAQKEHVIQVLRSVGGNRTRAAAILGISVRMLHYKLKGIPPARIPPVSGQLS